MCTQEPTFPPKVRTCASFAAVILSRVPKVERLKEVCSLTNPLGRARTMCVPHSFIIVLPLRWRRDDVDSDVMTSTHTCLHTLMLSSNERSKCAVWIQSIKGCTLFMFNKNKQHLAPNLTLLNCCSTVPHYKLGCIIFITYQGYQNKINFSINLITCNDFFRLLKQFPL